MTDSIPGYPPLPPAQHEVVPRNSEPFPVFTMRQMLAFADATAALRNDTTAHGTDAIAAAQKGTND